MNAAERTTRPAVVPLTGVDAPACVDALADAFVEYALLRYLVGDEGPGFVPGLRRLLEFFVAARFVRGEPVLGVRRAGGLDGVALVSFPDGVTPPGALDAQRNGLWRDLGDGARVRYEALGEAWGPLVVDVPHVRVNLLGVRRDAHGRGVGAALLDAVQVLSRRRPGSRGVFLTTEDPANVRYYRRRGFEERGSATIGPGFRTWAFFRPDERGGGAGAS